MRTAMAKRLNHQANILKGHQTRMAIIEARGLARTFTSRKRTVEAVRGVDLTVSDGEIVGFLGPNGAGKTTTLRMLTTLLRPTAGTATVAGADLLTDPLGVRRRIGYVPQAIGATGGGSDPNATVAEELTFQARMYRVPAGEIAALAGRLVFLDEPTTGLDPQSRSNLWEHIRKLRQELGTTVFLTTHYLEEADALCDRVLVIDYGRIVAAGTPEELKRRISGDVITLSVSGDPGTARDLLAGQPGVREVGLDGRALRLGVERGEEALPGLLRALDGAGLALESIQLARPSLDDVFLTVTGRSLRDDSSPALPARVPAGTSS